MIPPALREELAQRNREHGWHFHIEVSEADARDLASGYVPAHVQAMVLTMLEWEEIDRRRAARPVRSVLKKRSEKATDGDAVRTRGRHAG